MNRQQRRAMQGPPRAGAAAPDVRALFVAAAQQHKAGAHEAAARGYERVLALHPRHADALHLLGLIAIERRDPGRAVELLSRALEADAGKADAAISLGGLLKQMGRNAEAVQVLQRAVALKPDAADAFSNLGLALAELGRRAEAEQSLRRAIELRPDHAFAHNNLGVLLQESGRPGEAIDACRRAIELMPEYAAAYNNLGTALKETERIDEALAMFERAAALQVPGFENPLTNKAQLLIEIGRAGDAGRAVEQALAVNPRSGTAWLLRSELKTFDAGDPEIDAMAAIAADPASAAAGGRERVDLEFALAKSWLDAGDAARAFAHFDAGNRRKRAALAYDHEAALRGLRAVAAAFTPALMERLRGAGDPAQGPIFIVGMPRSGTSLVEQILASHPRVHGAGELSFVGEIAAGALGAAGFPDGISRLDAGAVASMGRDYRARLAARQGGRSHVVDKMPMNFQYAGLIHLMLPNARIVHCRRDPVDTCLSCYTKNLRSRLGFCFDQRELGTMYRAYERLMAHWRALLPAERFIEIDYERVVDDLEGEARRLIEFCGLAWDERCLSFHQTDRPVHTVSATQVRRPIYRASVGRWHAYAAQLAPLLAALEEKEA